MVRTAKQKGSGLFDQVFGTAVSSLSSQAQLAQKAAAEKLANEMEQMETGIAVQGLKSSGLSATQATAAESLIRSQGGISGTTSFLQRYITNPLKTAGSYLITNRTTVMYVLFALVAIGLIVWFFFKRQAKPAAQKAQDTANTLATAASSAPGTITLTPTPTTTTIATTGAPMTTVGISAGMTPLTETPPITEQNTTSTSSAPTAEAFQDVPADSIDPSSATLVNLQPMTIAQAGYLGPPKGGRFDPEAAVTQALRAGFRAFVLQIDYLDVRKGADFAAPGQPTLVYKGPDGALLNANTGSIQKVAETIANVGYRPDVPNYVAPIIIYLHVLRTPSAVRSPEAYLNFLSKIAKELNPLAPTHLGLTPLGTFHRQKRESELLNTPMSAFIGKTIILSNADTTLFRAPVKATGKRFDPAEDLDYLVNMRVYLDNDERLLGVSRMADTDMKPAAVVVHIDDLMPQISVRADAFALKGKRRFVIAMPNALENPTPAQLSRAINEFGVNMLPLDIFTPTPEEARELVMEYTAMSYRPKPAALRNV